MATKNKKHSPKKTASRNTKTSRSRKPNPTIQTSKKNNQAGKDTRSKTNTERKAGLKKIKKGA